MFLGGVLVGVSSKSWIWLIVLRGRPNDCCELTGRVRCCARSQRGALIVYRYPFLEMQYSNVGWVATQRWLSARGSVSPICFAYARATPDLRFVFAGLQPSLPAE